MAIETGAAVAPAWLPVLDAAAEWGLPPWELAGGGSALWYLRWAEYRIAKMKAEKRMTEKAKRKHGR